MGITKFGRYALVASIAAAIGLGTLLYEPSANAMPEPPIGKRAPDFTAQGADGKLHKLSDYRGSTVVLEWTNPKCEFSAEQYDTGNMQRTQAFASQHKIVWLSINTASQDKSGYLTANEATVLIKKRGATITSFLFDTSGTVGRLYGATSTPTVFVVDGSGNLRYSGAVSPPWKDPRTAQNYVKEALTQIMAHKSVAIPRTRQYGCSIKY